MSRVYQNISNDLRYLRYYDDEHDELVEIRRPFINKQDRDKYMRNYDKHHEWWKSLTREEQEHECEKLGLPPLNIPKNFACAECDKNFYDESSLRLHVRTKHRGEKPFRCQYCSKKYASHSGLYCHLNRSRNQCSAMHHQAK